MRHTVRHINSNRARAKFRRLALLSQGLLQAKPFGKGLHGAQNALEHLSYVQLDTISVVERAHHHVLFSRVPDYHPQMLNTLLENKRAFEYWSHAAAVLPISDFRFSLPYKHALKAGQTHWFKHPDRTLMKRLLREIEQNGPMRSRDFENTRKGKGDWWDWKPAKKALEQLFMEGDLMVSHREGFQKVYDVTERVLPAHIDSRPPSIDEFAEHLISTQLKCHGFVSEQSFTYLRKNPELRKAVASLLKQMVSESELEQVFFETSKPYYIRKHLLEMPSPKLSQKLHILSPFDNSVIQRQRLSEVFHFDYQIECYVPQPKRKFGYFSLPLLYQDSFVGRIDCKAHRHARILEIKTLHFESQGLYEDETLLHAFAKSIKAFCAFQNCDSLSIERVLPARSKHILLEMLKNWSLA